MEQRAGRRIKRRLTCEFFDGARSHRGIILDVGPSGVFIRTNAVLSPGTQIDIHLATSVAAPAMTLLGTVVRRKSVPATLTTLIQPGLGVKIIEAPREFGLLTANCELEEAIETDYAGARVPRNDQQQQAQQPLTTKDSRVEPGESDRAAESSPPAKDPERSGTAEETEKKRPQSAKTAAEKAPKRETVAKKRTEQPKPPRPLVAVLVGGAALGEIAEILRNMEVKTIECGPYDPQLAALDDAQLLVVSAEIAMSDPIPVDTDMLVGVAVCGDISETLRSQIRQQGYRYLLRPHVHPEALRMLLRYAIYAERDRRGRVRHPVGCEVGWRAGWKHNRGRLLDISHGGCCLLVEKPPKVGAKIAIKIPAETVGGQALKLRGKVLRSTPNAAHHGNERTALGVILDGITPSVRTVLVELCERWSESPPMLPRGKRPRSTTSAVEKSDGKSIGSKPRTETSQTPAEKSPESQTRDSAASALQDSSSDSADRSTRRGVFEQEIVQVDEESRVVQALLGRDLSLDG
ncbi:MAG: PilZ domain-containing protein, partial [Deltaproteobacteria bacterium]|nr:PilZ domain-containing protein [Deltaproteobacteria bacterium]